MPTTTAEIITIGDELLYGQTLDTNSHWMSEKLDETGIHLIRKTTLNDKKEEIISVLNEAKADVILITGGLGPTNDDLTKHSIVEYFNTHLINDQQVLNNIQNHFKKMGRNMTELNVRQADIPANSFAIHNALGTAPGLWIEENNKIYVFMPGVPFEMKKMMIDQIIPKLKSRCSVGNIYHKIIRTVGISESALAERIKGWEQSLPKHIRLAYLPSLGMVKLRLTTMGNDGKTMNLEIMKEVERVLPVIQKYVYGFDSDVLEVVIGNLLKSQNKKLAIAESCTGGYLSHMITSVPGSSEWFKGSIVPYDNEIKSEQLKVSNEILQTQGAVSESVARILAENVRIVFNADVAVSVSGIAGPTGSMQNKPVGTVWVAYADEHKTSAKLFHYSKDRTLNIKLSSIAALNMIRLNLKKT